MKEKSVIAGDYAAILEAKKRTPKKLGFTPESLNPLLKPFQAHCVKTALEHGQFALFEDCGLGKTFQQLEFAHQVVKHTGKPVIVLAPLAVVAQTINEGKKFGIEVNELIATDHPTGASLLPTVYITNYEQLDNIEHLIEWFIGVVLDESSILKNFTGETKKKILLLFANTHYKLACTATPSPNDLNEIGNHSEFLNILDSTDMRSKWFVRDEGMNNYRLKEHGKPDFFAWISSWALMFCKPSDIGFNDDGYVLPELNFIERNIVVKNRAEFKLFNESNVDATSFNKEVRITILERIDQVADIVNASDESFIIWSTLNDEGKQLRKLIPEAIEVAGSDSSESKKNRLLSFANSEYRVLISKAKIAGMGMNFQNCHNQVITAPDFSFEKLYQQIRRSYRFGQKHAVNIYIITTDTMENVIKSILRKEKQFIEMQTEMSKAINGQSYGLVNEYTFKEFKNDKMHLMKGDTAIEISRIPDNSVDFIVFSPPFKSLFTYSNYIHDLGNNDDSAGFWNQYLFIVKECYRILKPGRIMACHTKDLGVYKNSSGYTGMDNFTDQHTMFIENALSSANSPTGFKLHSKTTIWCDPVLEMQRTKTQRLLYKTLTSNSALTGIGMAEYMRYFKKWDGTDESNWEPVTHLKKTNIPLDLWQKWASPVWMDIKRTDVLNNKEGTDMGDEKHIAPLQLEVIHRCINLWSNPGETVFTPFLGIGSEAYVAINNNRYAIGCELKDSYFDTAVKNCNKAIGTKSQGSLFDTGLYEPAAGFENGVSTDMVNQVIDQLAE